MTYSWEEGVHWENKWTWSSKAVSQRSKLAQDFIVFFFLSSGKLNISWRRKAKEYFINDAHGKDILQGTETLNASLNYCKSTFLWWWGNTIVFSRDLVSGSISLTFLGAVLPPSSSFKKELVSLDPSLVTSEIPHRYCGNVLWLKVTLLLVVTWDLTGYIHKGSKIFQSSAYLKSLSASRYWIPKISSFYSLSFLALALTYGASLS